MVEHTVKLLAVTAVTLADTYVLNKLLMLIFQEDLQAMRFKEDVCLRAG